MSRSRSRHDTRQNPLRRLSRRWHKPSATAFAAQSADRVFEPTEQGSAIFGRWITDDAGLPAYEYTLDQYADPRAKYPNSERRDRRDHWHQIGNDRVTALASNDGTVQVYLGDRGGVFLNRFAMHDDTINRTQEMPLEPAQSRLTAYLRLLLAALGRLWFRLQWWWRHVRVPAPKHAPMEAKQIDHVDPNSVRPRGSPTTEPVAQAQFLARREPARFSYAGGFSYIDDGEAIWSTAYRYRAANSDIRRVFGMGYYETITICRDIRVTRRIYAPPGDVSALLIDETVENLRPVPVTLSVYEYWDVNVHQLKLQWLRGDPFYTLGDAERSEINGLFLPQMRCEGGVLRLHQQPIRDDYDPDAISDIDFAPANVFLADLSGDPDAIYVDKYAFFGSGSADCPETVRQRYASIPDAPSTDSMPYCLVMRRDVQLASGEKAELRYAYGSARPTDALDWLATLRAGSLYPQTREYWRQTVAYFNTGEDPVLTRETAWHSAYLLSATVYNAYYRTFLTPQGSAYLYLHGADGAPRDQALFALPLTYVRPDLARGNLKLIMALTHHRTGAIPYAFAGHGFQSDAFIHDAPSDLDLFFLLALNEYLAATGDFAFLDEEVPFYCPSGLPTLPPGARGITILDHARAAIHHLIHAVGTGANGLIKIGDGDWSDGVVFDAATRFGGIGALGWFLNSKRSGESIPNTQMALYVLPLTVALLRPYDDALAAQIEAFVEGLETALTHQWNGRWYTRAVLRDGDDQPVIVDNNRLNLEAQPWALISGAAARAGIEAELIRSLTTLLDDPSPNGAPLLERGMIWPAVSQLLTWGYTRSRPDLAWRSLLRHTFAAHAEAFPETWINVWSGPDGVHCKEAELDPGGTWMSPATPMTDFPVMNMNQHAMALLGLIRVCGIEPTADGLRIAPHVPRDRFVLDTALLRLDVSPGQIAGEYRPIADGTITLTIRVPETAQQISVTVDGIDATTERRAGGEIAFPLEIRHAKTSVFVVRWT